MLNSNTTKTAKLEKRRNYAKAGISTPFLRVTYITANFHDDISISF
jgi:hypothetical protein